MFIFCLPRKSLNNLIWAQVFKTNINNEISTEVMHIITTNSPLVVLLTDASFRTLRKMSVVIM
jgi:hypothetical protein